MKCCYSCGGELTLEGKPGRGDSCPRCNADLRACRNCRFHHEAASGECQEPVAERVSDKEKANFCDFFEFRHGGESQTGETKEETLKKLNDLFGGL